MPHNKITDLQKFAQRKNKDGRGAEALTRVHITETYAEACDGYRWTRISLDEGDNIPLSVNSSEYPDVRQAPNFKQYAEEECETVKIDAEFLAEFCKYAKKYGHNPWITLKIKKNGNRYNPLQLDSCGSRGIKGVIMQIT